MTQTLGAGEGQAGPRPCRLEDTCGARGGRPAPEGAGPPEQAPQLAAQVGRAAASQPLNAGVVISPGSLGERALRQAKDWPEDAQPGTGGAWSPAADPTPRCWVGPGLREAPQERGERPGGRLLPFHRPSLRSAQQLPVQTWGREGRGAGTLGYVGFRAPLNGQLPSGRAEPPGLWGPVPAPHPNSSSEKGGGSRTGGPRQARGQPTRSPRVPDSGGGAVRGSSH